MLGEALLVVLCVYVGEVGRWGLIDNSFELFKLKQIGLWLIFYCSIQIKLPFPKPTDAEFTFDQIEHILIPTLFNIKVCNLKILSQHPSFLPELIFRK